MPNLRWLAVLPLVVVAACLEVEQTITIAADGSGTQDVRVAMSEATLVEVRRAAAMQPDAANPLLVFDRAGVERELKDVGVDLVDYASETRKGRRSVTLQTRFAGLDALRKSPFCGSAAVWEVTAGPQAGTVKLTLFPQGKQAWIDARLKAEEMRSTTDAVADEFFRKRQKQLDGLDITLRLKLPGKVLLHTRNLEQTGPQEVVARITAEQIKTPEDLVRRLAPRFEVVIDAADCKLPLDAR